MSKPAEANTASTTDLTYVGVRIRQDVLDAADAMADRDGTTRSEVIRRALEVFTDPEQLAIHSASVMLRLISDAGRPALEAQAIGMAS